MLSTLNANPNKMCLVNSNKIQFIITISIYKIIREARVNIFSYNFFKEMASCYPAQAAFKLLASKILPPWPPKVL